MYKGVRKLRPKAKNGRPYTKKWPDEWSWEKVTLGSSVHRIRRKYMSKILISNMHECSFCRGKGEKPLATRCGVCGGKGTVSIDPPAVICAYCKGSGEEKQYSNLTCSVCKGKGVVQVQEPVERCSHCSGTGEEPTNKLPCSICRGRGVITVKGKEGRIASWSLDRKQHESDFFSLYKPHLETQSLPLSRTEPNKNLYEETGWSQYRIHKKEKDKKEKISLNMATIHGIAKRLIAREWARILGKKK